MRYFFLWLSKFSLCLLHFFFWRWPSSLLIIDVTGLIATRRTSSAGTWEASKSQILLPDEQQCLQSPWPIDTSWLPNLSIICHGHSNQECIMAWDLGLFPLFSMETISGRDSARWSELQSVQIASSRSHRPAPSSSVSILHPMLLLFLIHSSPSLLSHCLAVSKVSLYIPD